MVNSHESNKRIVMMSCSSNEEHPGESNNRMFIKRSMPFRAGQLKKISEQVIDRRSYQNVLYNAHSRQGLRSRPNRRNLSESENAGQDDNDENCIERLSPAENRKRIRFDRNK